jgi:hypothetical protein
VAPDPLLDGSSQTDRVVVAQDADGKAADPDDDARGVRGPPGLGHELGQGLELHAPVGPVTSRQAQELVLEARLADHVDLARPVEGRRALLAHVPAPPTSPSGGGGLAQLAPKRPDAAAAPAPEAVPAASPVIDVEGRVVVGVEGTEVVAVTGLQLDPGP